MNGLERERESAPKVTCPFLPCWGLSVFWKVLIVCTGVLMLVICLTLFSIASALSRHTTDSHEMGLSIIAKTDKLNEEIQLHRQMTLENRAVQTEIKGMLTTMQQGVKPNPIGKEPGGR